METPNLFLISAPSGTGKSSLINAVLAKANQLNFPLELSISYTTRKPRKGETDSDHYFFVSFEKFTSMRDSGFFLETAEVHGNWYGTSLDFIQSKLDAGISLILEIDVQGFRQISNLSFKHESIFILPPSIASLEERIKNRGDNDDSSTVLRLKNAKEELSYAYEYQHMIVNDSFEIALEILYGIITNKKMGSKLSTKELKEFLSKLLSS